MNDDNQGDNMNTTGGFIAGLLIGGMAGAGAMLLLAPQSGKRTRAQIQRQGRDLRDQATGTIEDAVVQARIKARQISADVRGQAEDLQHRGEDMFDEQKERLFVAVDAGKKALQGSRN